MCLEDSKQKNKLQLIIQRLKEIRSRLIQIRDQRELNKLMIKLKNGKS